MNEEQAEATIKVTPNKYLRLILKKFKEN